MRAVVSVPPLREIVLRVLPAGSEVVVLVPPGASPHSYALSPSDVLAIDEADLIVTVGLGLEGASAGALRRADRAKVVEFAKVIGLGAVNHEDLADHADHTDHAHAHSHDGDPHLWLDPELMIQLVEALGEHLAAGGDAEAVDRAAQVSQEIRDADARTKAALAPFKGSRLLTQHNGWQCFADHYGFEILGSVLPAGGGEPTPADITRAVEAVKAARLASDAPIAIMTEPQLNARLARRLADQLGVRVGVLDPMGEGDWFALLERNTRELVEVLSPFVPPPE